jgi:hypothetical protein
MNYHLLTLPSWAPSFWLSPTLNLISTSMTASTWSAPWRSKLKKSSKTFPNSGLDYLVLFLGTMMLLDPLLHVICLVHLGQFAGIDFPM